MILGFKNQFILPIINGEKVHTIRQDINNRWRVGMNIHFVTGARTKNYNQFFSGKCVSIQRFAMFRPAIGFGDGSIVELSLRVQINGRDISEDVLRELVKNDGFDNVEDFISFFKESFFGKIIHWTDYKYNDTGKKGKKPLGQPDRSV